MLVDVSTSLSGKNHEDFTTVKFAAIYKFYCQIWYTSVIS